MFSYFYHRTIRKIVASFGTLFNNIMYMKYDSAGNEVERAKVPISYAPKSKFLYDLAYDSTLTKPISVQLPRMSFELTGYQYDSTRKQPTIQRILNRNQLNQHLIVNNYQQIPYDFSFELNIYTRNIEDMHQIVEQILPYFTPDFTVTVGLVQDQVEIKRDISFIIDGVAPAVDYQGDSETPRYVTCQMTFTVKAYLYGPSSGSGIIRKSIIQLYDTVADPVQFNLVVDLSSVTTEYLHIPPVPNTAISFAEIYPPGMLPTDHNYSIEGRFEIMDANTYDALAGISILLNNEIFNDVPYEGNLQLQFWEYLPQQDLRQFAFWTMRTLGGSWSLSTSDPLPYKQGDTIYFRIDYDANNDTASFYTKVNPTDDWAAHGLNISGGLPNELPSLVQRPYSVGGVRSISSGLGNYHQYAPIYYIRMYDGANNELLGFNPNLWTSGNTLPDEVIGPNVWHLLGNSTINVVTHNDHTNYLFEEEVFSGNSWNGATWTGRVYHWANNTGHLDIYGVQGKFPEAGDIVVGVDSGAEYIISTVNRGPLKHVQIVTEPAPNTANVGSANSFSTTILEFPNTNPNLP